MINIFPSGCCLQWWMKHHVYSLQFLLQFLKIELQIGIDTITGSWSYNQHYNKIQHKKRMVKQWGWEVWCGCVVKGTINQNTALPPDAVSLHSQSLTATILHSILQRVLNDRLLLMQHSQVTLDETPWIEWLLG